MNDIVVAFMTAPDVETAETIARALVEERLAACCNILPQVRSIYRWEEAIEQADEILVVIKTTASGFEALRDRAVELHPYDVPEVIALPVVSGHEPYAEWVRQAVGMR
jgi:periplasmic divalent cation tolerance protein